MAKITGRMGKTSGSPNGPDKFKQEVYMTNSEASTLLRELAQEIEAGGRVEASSSTWSLGVNPMPPIKIEVQYKNDKKEMKIKVKLKENP
jgi:amphi-Trp domain-containing protein